MNIYEENKQVSFQRKLIINKDKMSSLDHEDNENMTNGDNGCNDINDQMAYNSRKITEARSERNKKRLKQMRRRKENAFYVDEENEEPENDNENEEKGEQGHSINLREAEGLFNGFQKASKRFQSEDSNELNPYKNPQERNEEDQGSVLSESLEEGNKNDIEVIVSDLECDLSNEIDNNDNWLSNNNPNHLSSKINSLIYCATSNQKKSFIQFNNQLKSSLESAGKGTLSYLMALGEITPDQKPNYNVESVIEEEPENCAEVESEKRRKDMQMSACLTMNKNSNCYNNLMAIPTSNNNSTNICLHKGSKSELPNIHSIIQSIQIVLEKRMTLQSELRLKKIFYLKNALVETFKRPNSFNDFVYNNSLAIGNNIDSYSSFNKRNILPLSVDLNPIKLYLPSDEDERISLLNESKNSLLEVKDTNVNFEQELNLQMEKNNIPAEEIGRAFTEANIVLSSGNTSNIPNTGTSSSWSNTKKNKKQKVKAISYEISSAIKVEIVNPDTLKQDKAPKQHKQSRSKVSFANNNYFSNNINNISINIFPLKQQATSPKQTFNQSHNSSITRDIRKHLLISQGKAQSLFLNKSTFGEELHFASSKKKSMPINHVSTHPTATITTAAIRQRGKNDIKHCLTYNNTHNENSTCMSYINFITDNPLPLSDIFLSIPNDKAKGNKKAILEAIKYLNFPFSSLDHQRFAIDRLIKSRSKSYCLFIQKDINKAKTYVYNEFKAVYEMNTDRGLLSKIYSISLYPFTVEYNEVKYIFKFDGKQKAFIPLHLNEFKAFSSDIHCFTLSSIKKATKLRAFKYSN